MNRHALQAISALLLLAVASIANAQNRPASQSPDRVYRTINDSATPAIRRIELAEAFLANSDPAYLNAAFRDNVYLALLQSYVREKDWLKMLDAVDRMEQLVPKTPRDRKLQILSEAMTVAGGEARVPARQIAYAEKIVALDPENINALRTLVTVGPVAEGPAAMDAATERVMGYSRKILALRKPERISDGEWRRFRAEIQEQTHAIVFRKLMNSGDHAGCVAAFEELVMLAPTDASAQYRLGVCYLAGTSVAAERANAASLEVAAFIRECAAERSCGSPENTSRNEALLEKQEQRMQDFEKLRDKAIDALAVSVAVGGDLTEIAASRELERAWRAKNSSKDNPLDGLDALIALKKKEIGGK